MHPPTTEIYTLSLHDALPISFERQEMASLIVVKRDGTREPYARHKIERGIWIACTKRPVTQQQVDARSEEHTSELQSRQYLVCRLLLEKKKEGRKRAVTRQTP